MVGPSGASYHSVTNEAHHYCTDAFGREQCGYMKPVLAEDVFPENASLKFKITHWSPQSLNQQMALLMKSVLGKYI